MTTSITTIAKVFEDHDYIGFVVEIGALDTAIIETKVREKFKFRLHSKPESKYSICVVQTIVTHKLLTHKLL
jgi:hypothetical protein